MKKISRRSFLQVAGVSAAAMGLAACGNNSSSAAASGSAASGGATGEKITLRFWTLALQPTFTDFIQGLIDKYEADHENITIEWEDLPWDGIQEKFLAQSAGNDQPDVVNLWSQIALTYASKGALLDLETVATEEQKSIYLEAAYDSARLGDSVYAFPWYATPNICVYNKKMLEDYGMNEAPTDFAWLLDNAIPFHEKTGAYLFTPPTVFHLFYNYGIPMVTEDKTAACFDTPEAVELLTKLKEIGDAGAINTVAGSWDDWDGDRQLFANRKLAMVLGGPQTVSRLRDEASADVMEETAVGECVMGPGQVVGEAIMNLVVGSKTKHPVEAVDFANFITNDENQLAFCHEVSIFPTTKAAAADPFFASDMETLEGQANYYASKSAMHAVDMTLGMEQDEDIKREIDIIMEKIFASGMTPEAAIDEAMDAVNALL